MYVSLFLGPTGVQAESSCLGAAAPSAVGAGKVWGQHGAGNSNLEGGRGVGRGRAEG